MSYLFSNCWWRSKEKILGERVEAVVEVEVEIDVEVEVEVSFWIKSDSTGGNSGDHGTSSIRENSFSDGITNCLKPLCTTIWKIQIGKKNKIILK